MARPVSPIANKEQFQLLRSIYFNQSLPFELTSQPNGVVALLEFLKSKELIIRTQKSFELTRKGLGALRNYVGDFRIPMIDVPEKYLLDENAESGSFEVRSSLGRQLLKRVSSDE